jgi:uncharacterized protein YkwD
MQPAGILKPAGVRENELDLKAPMKISLHFAIACVAVVAITVGVATAQSESPERQIFEAANQARRVQGLMRLKWDASLAQAAHQHAAAMARENTLSHQLRHEPDLAARASHAGVYFISISENVAQGPNPANLSEQWENSPAHRQNLLDSDMNVIGIGVVERNGELFAVEDFAKIKPPSPVR